MVAHVFNMTCLDDNIWIVICHHSKLQIGFFCVKLFLTNSSTLLSRSFHRNSQHPKDSKLNAPNSPQQKEIEVFTEYSCIEKKNLNDLTRQLNQIS
jgi:hypothetical protein